MKSSIRAIFSAAVLVTTTQAVLAAGPIVTNTGAVPIPDCNTAFPECQEWQQFAAAANASAPVGGGAPAHPVASPQDLMKGWLLRCEVVLEKLAHETPAQATQACTKKYNAWLKASQQ